jgi:hypothetical protein
MRNVIEALIKNPPFPANRRHANRGIKKMEQVSTHARVSPDDTRWHWFNNRDAPRLMLRFVKTENTCAQLVEVHCRYLIKKRNALLLSGGIHVARKYI